MKFIEDVGEAQRAILNILAGGYRSAGDITRKLMGVGLLPNNEQSYALVAVALAALAAKDLVKKSGNGKSKFWRLKD